VVHLKCAKGGPWGPEDESPPVGSRGKLQWEPGDEVSKRTPEYRTLKYARRFQKQNMVRSDYGSIQSRHTDIAPLAYIAYKSEALKQDWKIAQKKISF